MRTASRARRFWAAAGSLPWRPTVSRTPRAPASLPKGLKERRLCRRASSEAPLRLLVEMRVLQSLTLRSSRAPMGMRSLRMRLSCWRPRSMARMEKMVTDPSSSTMRALPPKARAGRESFMG